MAAPSAFRSEISLLEAALTMQRILGNSELRRQSPTPGKQQLDHDPFLMLGPCESTGSSTARLQPDDTIELISIKSGSEDGEQQNRSQDRTVRARLLRRFKDRRNWRFGLHAGLYASVAVLLSNLTLLSVGLAAHDNAFPGMTTIAKEGETYRTTAISTALHALINVMSTILLTTSNYAMQILSAPTRQEIDRAHARGQCLEVGIMSVHNLRHIERKRVYFWLLLALSSAPLHLL
jgi:hypothetical protein